MTKQLGFVFCALLFAGALSACDEVKNCEVGTPGCVGGAPVDGKCEFELIVRNGKCVEPGMGGGDGDGSDDDGGMPGDDDGEPLCECDNPEDLCTSDGQCVNYCEAPEKIPGSEADQKPEVVNCFKLEDEPDLTFAEVCARRCKLRCQRIDWFCPESDACAEDACAEDNAAMLAECATDCAADIMCLQESCDTVRGAGCGDTTCPSGDEPDCTNVKCSNDCRIRFDGWCDDGDTFGTSNDPTSEDSALCTWGTDCADCGPRRGTNADAPVNLPQGSQCNFNDVCAGYSTKQDRETGKIVPDLENLNAWCVLLEGPGDVPGNRRCVPDASGKEEKCPPGYKLVELVDGLRNPITVDGLTAKGCVPTFDVCE